MKGIKTRVKYLA